MSSSGINPLSRASAGVVHNIDACERLANARARRAAKNRDSRNDASRNDASDAAAASARRMREKRGERIATRNARA